MGLIVKFIIIEKELLVKINSLVYAKIIPAMLFIFWETKKWSIYIFKKRKCVIKASNQRIKQ